MARACKAYPTRTTPTGLAMLARVAICVALLLPGAPYAQPASTKFFDPSMILVVHGITMSWRGIPVNGTLALKEQCFKTPQDDLRKGISILFSPDTTQRKRKQIEEILQRCGFKPVMVISVQPISRQNIP